MSRRIALTDPWASLARELGSVAALAEVCGVTTRTLQRWSDGTRSPSELQRADVRARLRRRGLRSPW